MFKISLKNIFRARIKLILIILLFVLLITFTLLFGGIKKGINQNLEDIIKKSYSGSCYLTSYENFNSNLISLSATIPVSIDKESINKIENISKNLVFSERIKIGGGII